MRSRSGREARFWTVVVSREKGHPMRVRIARPVRYSIYDAAL